MPPRDATPGKFCPGLACVAGGVTLHCDADETPQWCEDADSALLVPLPLQRVFSDRMLRAETLLALNPNKSPA